LIKQLRIENYRCFEKLEIELGPFNVLVGPNDSGKSTIMEAIDFLARQSTGPNQAQTDRPSTDVGTVIRGQDPASILTVSITGEVHDGTEFEHSLSLAPGEDQRGRGVFHREGLQFGGETWIGPRDESAEQFDLLNPVSGNGYSATPGSPAMSLIQQASDAREFSALGLLRSEYEQVQIYRLDPAALRSTEAAGRGHSSDQTLSARGGNLPATLRSLLLGPDRSAFQAVEEELCRIVPSISGLWIEEREPTRVMFKLRTGSDVEASSVSDGVLLLLAFLTLLHRYSEPLVLLIEEPENGLHPHRIGEVVQLLRRLVEGGKNRQVILTTHSPILLNHVEPEEVLICRRAESGWTEVTPLKEVKDLERYLTDFDVGELWYNLGEDRLTANAD